MRPYDTPPILSGTVQQQVQQMREFMMKTILDMNRRNNIQANEQMQSKPKQIVEAAQTPVRPGLKINEVVDKIYPVGSIYISAAATNPKELFGGEWQQIQGRFLLAASSSYAAGSTGGEATHTLTVNEMPKHGHQVFVWDNAGTLGDAYYYDGATKKTHSGARLYNGSASTWIANGSTANAAGSGRGDPSGGTALVGGNAAHNNMPPYLAVYVWQRTA